MVAQAAALSCEEVVAFLQSVNQIAEFDDGRVGSGFKFTQVFVVDFQVVNIHGFPQSTSAFKAAQVQLTTLSNYDAVVEEGLRTGYIDEDEIATLQEWRKDPAKWDPDK